MAKSMTSIVGFAPWFSPYADIQPVREPEPQERIEKCLNCALVECVNCLESGVKTDVGRPSKFDPELLRELLTLRRTNDEICSQIGVSERSLRKYKKMLSQTA